MEFLGAPACGDHLEFPLRENDADELRGIDEARSLVPGQYVCIHPGARYASRRWGAERFAAVADGLVRRGFHAVITGSAWEAELARDVERAMHEPAVNLAGRTTLGSLAGLLAGAR
ncbi:MAG TPA: glycosyltransferase family 9 protein, partial [Pirellulales bacterium]|nr:glycosyltransferase family 9 protein [Pirellulales bacterium]